VLQGSCSEMQMQGINLLEVPQMTEIVFLSERLDLEVHFPTPQENSPQGGGRSSRRAYQRWTPLLVHNQKPEGKTLAAL